MAITSYNDLAGAIKAWCARSDSTFSNQIETFVALHELTMYNGRGDDGDPLQCDALMAPEIEVSVPITFTAGVAAMPADASTVRTLTRPGDRIGVDYVTPRQYDLMVANATGGAVRAFTVKAGQILLTPSFDGDFTILYYRQLPAISVGNPTNDLLTKYPLLYFHGCMFEAFSFMQNSQKALEQFTRYRSALAGVNQSNRGVRFGGTPLRIVQRNAIP